MMMMKKDKQEKGERKKTDIKKRGSHSQKIITLPMKMRICPKRIGKTMTT